MALSPNNTKPASQRGERLYPPQSSRLYWPLTSLRHCLIDVIANYLANRNHALLIDYGCGNMPYRFLFEPHVTTYLGYDLQGNELADGELDANHLIPVSLGTVDIVLSSQVLEHVEAPENYLKESRRVLKPDGLLILSTHGVWKYHPDPCDYWRWTSSGLMCTVENAGFSVLDFRGILGPAATGLQIWQDAVLPRLPWPFRKPFTFLMQRIIRMADRACPSNIRDRDASIYLLVARRT